MKIYSLQKRLHIFQLPFHLRLSRKMILISLVFISISSCLCQGSQRPLVIGHRGTAYLPELTLASQSLAHAYGADIIEIDVCLTEIITQIIRRGLVRSQDVSG